MIQSNKYIATETALRQSSLQMKTRFLLSVTLLLKALGGVEFTKKYREGIYQVHIISILFKKMPEQSKSAYVNAE